MGQINCQCQSETEIDLMEENRYVLKKTKKPKTRVKSIVSPRFALKSCSNQNSFNDLDIPSPSFDQQFCKLLLVSETSKYDFDVPKKGIKIGTEPQADFILPKLSLQDAFQTKFVYRQQKLYVKDSGIGLGAFLFKTKVTIPITSNFSELLEVSGEFMMLYAEGKSTAIKWKKINTQSQQMGEIKGSKQVCDCRIQIKGEKLEVRRNEGFLQYTDNQCELVEGDVLRFGHSFYKIGNIRHYVNSSRLIHRY